jgi:hypothetical protein
LNYKVLYDRKLSEFINKENSSITSFSYRVQRLKTWNNLCK